MTNVNEIAPEVFQISTFVPEIDLQFNQFLVRDDESLLFHTGMNALFPAVHEAVARVIDVRRLRWIGFSHFEADECGSLNRRLEIAPHAEPACSFLGAVVSVNDFAARPARALADGEVLPTGRRRFRFLHTPHVPHCWEAGLMFEETERVLLCSDLFHQAGDVEPRTESDILGRARQTLETYQATPFAWYVPYTARTDGIMRRIADLEPRVVATMHGSAYAGDGRTAVLGLAQVMREVLG